MKRLLCAVLVLLLFPVLAGAADFDSFNMYAGVFGEKELDIKTAQETKGMLIVPADPCRVVFVDESGETKRIIVDGDGVPFLAYSMAAIMMFDPSSENYAFNAGQLLSSFLLARTNGEGTAQVSTGALILIQKQETGFFFTIGE